MKHVPLTNGILQNSPAMESRPAGLLRFRPGHKCFWERVSLGTCFN